VESIVAEFAADRSRLLDIVEAVRRAMLEVRRWNEGRLANFNQRLEAARKELGPKASGAS
jgi:hypothetical protein